MSKKPATLLCVVNQIFKGVGVSLLTFLYTLFSCHRPAVVVTRIISNNLWLFPVPFIKSRLIHRTCENLCHIWKGLYSRWNLQDPEAFIDWAFSIYLHSWKKRFNSFEICSAAVFGEQPIFMQYFIVEVAICWHLFAKSMNPALKKILKIQDGAALKVWVRVEKM